MMLWPAPSSRSSSAPDTQGTAQYPLSQQQTMPQPVVPLSSAPDSIVAPPFPQEEREPSSFNRRRYTRIFAIVVTLALAITIYFVWRSPTAPTTPPSISQQNFSNTTSNSNGSSTSSSTTNSGDIKVYVVGAVKHPGIYTLPPDARVSDLLQAAGGTLSNANLVALNLAAKLNDGQEVYVLTIGETPPTYTGGVPGPGTASVGNTAAGSLVNINTASVDDMRQSLHVSSTTAQNIVNYRTQHGPFTSVDQLLQVVSKSIYDKIKDLVTVS